MRIPIIAGNWKMNKTIAEAVALVEAIKGPLAEIRGVDKVVCPTAVCLPAVRETIGTAKIGLGAQNMYFEESGAYTGEIAPNMIEGLCEYVIIGHSERRGYFGETVEMVSFGGIKGGSKYLTVKAYLKYVELLAHKRKDIFSNISGKLVKKKTDLADYLYDLHDYMRTAGFIRFEVSLNSRFLTQNGLRYLGACTMKQLELIYHERAKELVREIDVEALDSLRPITRAIYYSWKSGEDIRSMYSKSQFYKYRKELRAVGVDIAMPYSEKSSPVNVRTITIRPAVMPDFYNLPKVA